MTPNQIGPDVFQVGDKVRLRPNTLAWRAEVKLKNETGEVVLVAKDGRISIRFGNGQFLKGRSIDAFEKIGFFSKKEAE